MTKNPKRIYVASSWRNNRQPEVVRALRREGHEVYDFRNSKGNNGFHWSEIDPGWKTWDAYKCRLSLEHPLAEEGFKFDRDAMCWADVFVGVMPFGRSASLEMGWGAGQGKQTLLLLEDGEPELMVKLLNVVCLNIEEVIFYIENGFLVLDYKKGQTYEQQKQVNTSRC